MFFHVFSYHANQFVFYGFLTTGRKKVCSYVWFFMIFVICLVFSLSTQTHVFSLTTSKRWCLRYCDVYNHDKQLSSTVFNHRSKNGKILNTFFPSYLKHAYDIGILFVHTKKTGMFCNSVMYIIALMKCPLGFFHGTGWPCSGFFYQPPGMCMFYECLIG